MTINFKVTGKQEFQSGPSEVTTNFVLSAVPGQDVTGSLQYKTKVQTAADAMNFGDIVIATIAHEA